MKKKEVLSVVVSEIDGERGNYTTEIVIACSPMTLTAALVELNYKINEAVNKMNILPKNGMWTLVCETVGEKLLEESKQ